MLISCWWHNSRFGWGGKHTEELIICTPSARTEIPNIGQQFWEQRKLTEGIIIIYEPNNLYVSTSIVKLLNEGIRQNNKIRGGGCFIISVKVIWFQLFPILQFVPSRGPFFCGMGRFHVRADYSDIISQPNGSWYITATTVKSFRRFVLTQRVFDHQDWSPMYYCWVSRPNCATRARTLFRKGIYVKGDSAPMKRIF